MTEALLLNSGLNSIKVLTLTFQAIRGLAPKYLCELIRIKEQSNYHLYISLFLSSEEIILAVGLPSEKSLTSLGNRASNLLPQYYGIACQRI